MTTKSVLPLNEQRQLLRLKLQAQRVLIASQLKPRVAEKGHYPRSMIMRFLTQQHGAKIITEIAAVMLGTHWLKSTYVQLFTKIAKPLILNKFKV